MSKYRFAGQLLTGVLLVVLLLLNACGEPTPTQPPDIDEEPTPEPVTVATNPSDLTVDPDTYNKETVELEGHVCLPGLLVDGRSGINLSGNVGGLENTYYHLTGVYDADNNTLDVSDFRKEPVDYLPIDNGKALNANLVPVSVPGLIATPPKDAENMLTGYISIAGTPQDTSTQPYVVYAENGFYLVLYDSVLSFPTEFTLSAGEVNGTLVKTPVEEIVFGPGWDSGEFDGVIIANIIELSSPVQTTVEEINASPGDYMFKRVSLNAGYLSTEATISYSEQGLVFGQGVLVSNFTSLFGEDTCQRLETIDLANRGWQMRQCQATGTVIYPTEAILTYLNYGAPLSNAEVASRHKPALIVETISDEAMETVDITDLNPLIGKSSQYWDKAVEFEGWLLGVDIPIKKVAQAIYDEDLAVNIELIGVGIANQSGVNTQSVIIGLKDELADEQGKMIYGKYRLGVAVDEMPDELFDVTSANTALFLLAKEELAAEVPTDFNELAISLAPPWAGKVEPGEGPMPAGSKVILTAIPLGNFVFDYWSGDASGTATTIIITMDSDKLVYANFKVITYSLDVSVMPAGTGSVTISPLLDSYEADSAVSLSANPASGYVFDYWSGDASGSTFKISVLMDSDKSITANFKQVK